jgi:hypothetical protein
MEPTEVLLAYAADFEASFKDDDWSRIHKYFADDSVYEVAGLAAFDCRITGPENISKGMKRSLDGMDRKFDSRTIEVTSELDTTEDSVALDWKVIYTKAGTPDFLLTGHSFARIKDDKIVEIRDSYTKEMEKAATDWMAEYGQDMDGSYV